MRNQKGITLVALVITIIVLLILAGVTIAALSGPNGILTNAVKSNEETALSQAKESVSMAISELLSDYYVTQTTTATDPADITSQNIADTVKANYPDFEINSNTDTAIVMTINGIKISVALTKTAGTDVGSLTSPTTWKVGDASVVK